jgi:putative oxidoreductase
MDLGMLLLRLVIGGLMIGHGTQKLFGWFGGHGVRGTAGWLQSVGYRPATPLAVMTGTAEAGGGLLLAAGFLTPLGAAAIAGVLFTAIVSVHWSQGLWNANGGGEFPLAVATSALVTAFVGPGGISVDAALGLSFAGTLWGLSALGLAVVASAVTLVSRAIVTPKSVSAEDHEAPTSETRAAA